MKLGLSSRPGGGESGREQIEGIGWWRHRDLYISVGNFLKAQFCSHWWILKVIPSSRGSQTPVILAFEVRKMGASHHPRLHSALNVSLGCRGPHQRINK